MTGAPSSCVSNETRGYRSGAMTTTATSSPRERSEEATSSFDCRCQRCREDDVLLPPTSDPRDAYKAARLAAKRRVELLQERRSFVAETVFSHPPTKVRMRIRGSVTRFGFCTALASRPRTQAKPSASTSPSFEGSTTTRSRPSRPWFRSGMYSAFRAESQYAVLRED